MPRLDQATIGPFLLCHADIKIGVVQKSLLRRRLIRVTLLFECAMSLWETKKISWFLVLASLVGMLHVALAQGASGAMQEKHTADATLEQRYTYELWRVTKGVFPFSIVTGLVSLLAAFVNSLSPALKDRARLANYRLRANGNFFKFFIQLGLYLFQICPWSQSRLAEGCPYEQSYLVTRLFRVIYITLENVLFDLYNFLDCSLLTGLVIYTWFICRHSGERALSSPTHKLAFFLLMALMGLKLSLELYSTVTRWFFHLVDCCFGLSNGAQEMFHLACHEKDYRKAFIQLPTALLHDLIVPLVALITPVQLLVMLARFLYKYYDADSTLALVVTELFKSLEMTVKTQSLFLIVTNIQPLVNLVKRLQSPRTQWTEAEKQAAKRQQQRQGKPPEAHLMSVKNAATLTLIVFFWTLCRQVADPVVDIVEPILSHMNGTSLPGLDVEKRKEDDSIKNGNTVQLYIA